MVRTPYPPAIASLVHGPAAIQATAPAEATGSTAATQCRLYRTTSARLINVLARSPINVANTCSPRIKVSICRENRRRNAYYGW